MKRAFKAKLFNTTLIGVILVVAVAVFASASRLAAEVVNCPPSYYRNNTNHSFDKIFVPSNQTCETINFTGLLDSVTVQPNAHLKYFQIDYYDQTKLGSFINFGTVGLPDARWGIQDAREITNFTNKTGGLIQGASYGIYVISVNDVQHIGIRTLNNEGIISGGRYAIYLSDAYSGSKSQASRIETIHNFGLITGNTSGINVDPKSSIGTINNAQGGDNPLTYSGVLPSFYNVVLGKTALDYGKLAATSVTGSTIFQIYDNSKVMSKKYSAVIEGLNPINLGLSGDGEVLSGKFRGANWTLQQKGGTGSIWDLLFDRAIDLGPSVEATQSALSAIAKSIKQIFGLQTAASNPGLSYDCSLFSAEGICLSFGAKSIMTSSEGGDAKSGVFVAGFRINPNLRIGGFIEQHIGEVENPGIRFKSNKPEFGLYGVWTERTDNTGIFVRAAARFGKNNVSIMRPVIDDSEQGRGTASLSSQAIQLTIGSGFRLDPNWIATPYAGLRYLKIERGSYTEDIIAGVVDYPLTYSRLTLETYTGVFGIAFTGDITERFKTSLSISIDHDFQYKINDLAAIGVDGISNIKFIDQRYRKTRPVVSAELSYAIDKTSRISGRITYREEAFQPISTTTAFIAYTKGF